MKREISGLSLLGLYWYAMFHGAISFLIGGIGGIIMSGFFVSIMVSIFLLWGNKK